MRRAARTGSSGYRSSSAGWASSTDEIVVTGTVREVNDGVAIVESEAEQDGQRIIRNGEAEVRV